MEPEQKANGKPSAGAYAELRKLLLPEGEELSRLQDRVSDPQLRAEDVSEVLPAALQMGTARGPELRSALRPLLEQALQISVQKDPALLADALFPILGRALRQAIGRRMRRAADAIARFLEQNLSWRGWRWRWQSLTSGQPFGDLVLAHSSLFRVQQIFLIHADSALLLQQCGAESGLVMEIQDYLRDSYGTPNHSPLEKVSFGGSEVWLQHGAQAILAAVVLGTPPHSLGNRLQHVLDTIHGAKAAELQNCNGDPSPFLSCDEELRTCLLGQEAAPRRRISPLWWLAAAVLLEVIGYWIFAGYRQKHRWEDYINRLNAQPGIVVTSVNQHGSSYAVTGLRDPLALEPASLLPAFEIDPHKVSFHWEPYHSLQPAFEAARRLINERQIVESQTLHFAPGSAEIADEDVAAIDQLARHVQALLPEGKKIEIVGHTDGTKLEEQQTQLALTRAEEVRRALIDAGVPQTALLARAAGTSQPLRMGNSDTDKLFNRYVSFRVD